MPKFEVTAPDGKVYEVEGPDGSTEDQAIEQVKAQLSKPASWGDTLASLPAQSQLGMESTAANLNLMGANERVRNLRDTPQEGFGETGGGAATGGYVTPTTVGKKTTDLVQASADSQIAAQDAETASALRKAATPKNQSWGQSVVSSAASSAAPTITGLAIGLLTKNPIPAMAIAGGGGAAMQGADTYGEAMEAGASHEVAARSAGIDAILEGAGEAIPLGTALKAGSPILKRLFQTVLQESGQEAVTQLAQDLNAYLSYNPNITVKEALYNMSVAAGSGALMGSVVGGLGHAVEVGREKEAKAKIDSILDPAMPPEERAKAVDELFTALKNSDTRSPSSSDQEVIPTTPPTPQSTAVAEATSLIDPDTITDEQLSKARSQVEAFHKALTETPDNPTTAALTAGLDVLQPGAEFGESLETANNRYLNSNDDVKRTDLPVLLGPTGEGLPLRKVDLANNPGVYMLGAPSQDRPMEYNEAVHDTLTEWVNKWMPGKTVLLLNQNPPTGVAVGWHTILPSGVHVITPAVLRNMKDSKAFNQHAQMKTFYNLAHEFGHALALDRFFENTDPVVAASVRAEAKSGVITPETITAAAPEIQPVLHEFNELKQGVLNGMPVREFISRWFGPSKVLKKIADEHGVHLDAPATQLVDAMIRRAVKRNVELSATQLKQMRANELGFDEYFAEQMARYAYAKELHKGTKFDTPNLFARAFASARQAAVDFFKYLKQEGTIAPGVKFEEWLDSLTKTGTPVKPGKGKSGTKTVTLEVKVKKPKGAPKAAPAAKKPVRTQDNVETTDEQKAATGRKLVAGLIRDEVIDKATQKELLAHIKNADWPAFTDAVQPYVEKKVKLELDDEIPEIKQMGLETDAGLLVQQFGANMYSGDIGGVVVKELVQNAFDAVKAARSMGQYAARTEDLDYGPNIDIKVDPKARTIEVSDNGIGMTPEIIQQALLTYPGSSKIGLKPEESSGGLGLAKVVILFVPTRIEITSVRDGVKTEIDTNPSDIIGKKIQARVSKVGPETLPGTTVRVTLPEAMERPGEGMQPLTLPTRTWDVPVLENGILDPDLKVTFNGGEGSYDNHVSTSPIYPLYKTLDFPWGEVDLYTDGEDRNYSIATIYSSGLYQFDTSLPLGGTNLPIVARLNIRPHVTAKNKDYPFDNNRQNLKPHVMEDMREVVKELFELVVQKRIEAAIKTYSNVQILPRIPGDGPLPKGAGLQQPQVRTYELDNRPRMSLSARTEQPLFHNNTNVNWIEKYPDALSFFARLGTWMTDAYAEVNKLALLGERKTKPLKDPLYIGVGIDKKLYGVNVNIPYYTIFLNPFATKFGENAEALTEEVWQTFIHEIAHNYVGSHDDKFANKLADISVALVQAGLRAKMYARLEHIVQQHYTVFQEMRHEYQQSSTKNLGNSIEGTARLIESYDRDGDPVAAIRAGEESESSGDVSEGTSPTPIHYELDSDGRKGFGLPHAGVIDTASLADAAREWKEKGFRSKYFLGWFGDWKTDPAQASKVLDADGNPLVLYHATTAKVNTERGEEPFMVFNKGDIGFHFGTARAAFVRGYNHVYAFGAAPPELGEAIAIAQNHEEELGGVPKPVYIMPVLLNLRNPLNIGQEDEDFWRSPETAARVLFNLKAIDVEDMLALSHEIKPMAPIRDQMKAIRDTLARKGYDGIVYENTVEGDTSYVAFYPGQIKSVMGTKLFTKSPAIHFELDSDMAKPEGRGQSWFRRKFERMVGARAFSPVRRALRATSRAREYLLSIQQQAHLRPDLVGLQMFNEYGIFYNSKKGLLQAPAEPVTYALQQLGKEDAARVSNFLRAENEAGELWVGLTRGMDGKFTYVPNEKFVAQLQAMKIDTQSEKGEKLAQLILDFKNSIMAHLNEAESVLTDLLQRRYGASPDTLKSQLVLMHKAIHDLRKSPFLPQGAFGNYVVLVQRKREGAPGYETVYRDAYEDYDEWKKAWDEAKRKAKPDEQVIGRELSDTQYVLMSLPHDFLELAITELDLQGEEADQLYALAQPVKVEKALRPYEATKARRNKVDIPRSYANFMWHNANLLAKMRYRSLFNSAIGEVRKELRVKERLGPIAARDVVQLNSILRMMIGTRDYVLNPPNEAHALRSFVALSYLWLNVKTAAVNIIGLGTTLADLTTQHGEVQGTKLFLSAMRKTWKSIKFTDLNAAKQGDYLRPEVAKLLDRAIKEGVLAQSYAYYLAGMANSGNLARMPGYQVLGKFSRQAIDLGMWAFRLTELGTRRATFIAKLEAELARKDRGMDDPYTAAVAATNKLQNEFSGFNRPALLRGISAKTKGPFTGVAEAAIPMLTVFMSFVQHMAFHAYGGYETGLNRQYKYAVGEGMQARKPRSWYLGGYTMKIMIMLLLLAGYEGLPGAENLLDVLDYIWKKLYGKHMRQELREFTKDIFNMDPVLAAHGMGHNVLGFDLSRSIGVGRLVPGTDVLMKSGSDPERTFGSLVLDLAGPTGGLIQFMLQSAGGKEPFPDNFKRFPGAIGNMVSSYVWARDGVRGPHRELITRDLNTGELRDLTTAEIYGKAFGFNPAIVSQNREKIFAKHDIRIYWQERRSGLMKDMFMATDAADREAIADVRKSIQEFNQEIPDEWGRMRIRPKDLAQSLKQARRTKRSEENGPGGGRRYQRLMQDVDDSFAPSNP